MGCVLQMVVVSFLHPHEWVAISKTHLTWLNQGFSLNLKFWSQFWGCIWKLGYEEGKLKGELFDDSLSYFEKLISNGDKIGIYSSGSIQAQKLLLEYSQHGNISQLFRQRFLYDRVFGKKFQNAVSDADQCSDCDRWKATILTQLQLEISEKRILIKLSKIL